MYAENRFGNSFSEDSEGSEDIDMLQDSKNPLATISLAEYQMYIHKPAKSTLLQKNSSAPQYKQTIENDP